MRARHDNVCLWWKDSHSCSCGYLEQEIRTEAVQECLIMIPNTFAVCGELYGDRPQYCSTTCWEKAEGEK